MTRLLKPETLTAEAFAPFGSVIETAGRPGHAINAGKAQRFDALATAQVGSGEAILSIFRAVAWPRPIVIEMLERHPLGSQAFYPVDDHPWLVVVGTAPHAASCRAFHATGRQGVQFNAGCWHHPLLVLQPSQDFLVVDRQGPGDNLEEAALSGGPVSLDLEALDD